MHIVNVNSPSEVSKYNSLLPGHNVMVMFYMDGCGFCELLKPEWNEFVKHIKKNHTGKDDKNVIAQVNSSFIRDVDGDKDVLGYPTIMHLLDGKKRSEFNDKRDKDELIKYFKNMSKSPGKQSGGRTKKRRRRIKKRRKNTRSRVRSKSRKNNTKKRRHRGNTRKRRR